MARHPRPLSEFERIVEELEEITDISRQIVTLARDAGLSSIHAHGTLVHNRLLPSLRTWAEKARFDTSVQVENHKRAKRDSAPGARKKRKVGN